MYKIILKNYCVPPGYIPKLLLIMKLTTFILLISLMQVSAATFGQRVTLKQKNLTIDKVFREIRKQTGYDVLMGYGDFKASKINANFNNASLTEVMDVVVKNTELTYSIEEKTIVIKRKNASFLGELSNRLNTIDVSGRVVDAEGRALPGASVSVKGKGKSVSTDANGKFYLKDVAEDEILVISFIGYVSREIKVAKELGDLALQISTSKLDEIQVIAYGTTTRRLSTSNIGTIKGEDIANQPTTNPLLTLIGRVPGIEINQTSGIPGSGVNVKVQGRNSIRSGNEAFYVIDGVPFPPQNLYSGGGGPLPNPGSTLNFLNPSDIESVEILKDADATAIYGSRAANGAILITTKKGKAGQTKVDVNMQTGWGKVTRRLDLMNTSQYLDMRREALKNANNAAIGVRDFDINGAWDQNRYTDWQDELIGGTASYNNFQTSISGGKEQTQFLAGVGYNKETSVFPGEYNDSKINARLSINHTSENQKFKANITASFLQDKNNPIKTDLTSVAIALAPNAPALRNADGSINWAIIDNRVTLIYNPLAQIQGKYQANTDNLLSNALLSYELLPGLNIKSSLGYNNISTKELNTTPQSTFPPTNTSNNRAATYVNKWLSSWIIEPQITYLKQFNFGKIDALVGTSFQDSKNMVEGFKASGFANDSQLENSKAASTTVPDANNMQSNYRYNAIFGRLNYSFKDKYVLNTTIRRDGSSRFGSANIIQDFYSIGAAWIFSEEAGFKKILNFIDFGKLRASYGTTGNDQISDYQFLSLYNNYATEVAYQGGVGLTPSNLSNPYLQWEATNKLNIGVELGFYKNRILLKADYARNRSSNQLLSAPLPFTTGFGSILRNLPATVQNTSWEFLLDAMILDNSPLTWRTSFNLTLPKNELVSYPDLENSTDKSNFEIGESLNIVKVYPFAGVNIHSGVYEVKTLNGQLSSNPNPNIDKTSFVNLDPKIYGGLSNTLSYSGFELNFLFQFVKQKAYNYRFGALGAGLFSSGLSNQPTSLLERWQKGGDVRNIQKVTTSFGDIFSSYGAATQSDAAYSDASYIRLKNASLSYLLPNSLISKINLKNARIFFQGQNLLTITNFEGLDPETKSVTTLPPLRIFSFGLQLTL